MGKYSGSRDWSGNPKEAPLLRCSTLWKGSTEYQALKYAPEQGIDISGCCPCGAKGTIAVGKKLDCFGTIFLNCPDCRIVVALGTVIFPDDVRDDLERQRLKDWEAWMREEGPEGYLKAEQGAACSSSTPQPPPPSQYRREPTLSPPTASSSTAAGVGLLPPVTTPVKKETIFGVMIKNEPPLVVR
ncbi:hypothetical protein BC835DRAFT_1418572 [Cytidiella melzeri]|nr:hypothetical protein BC835DRAFT_1418572 [Cytidiella melzeri]